MFIDFSYPGQDRQVRKLLISPKFLLVLVAVWQLIQLLSPGESEADSPGKLFPTALL
jgi:hypothetical protein